ncbi:MAG: radical SAM protein [Zetaproteobacteria bacterium]|nr:radical SAM protein [Zetaproteobacteria bacterium]
MQLTTANHDRDVMQMRYVYPVVSRRAGGLSIGININTNHACDWHCVYCQVPNLMRGAAPTIDFALLEEELRAMLHCVIHGSFLEKHVPQEMRQLCDVAISGNGEPTSTRKFTVLIQCVIGIMADFELAHLPLRLISNGSYMSKRWVQEGLALMDRVAGEVWIKVDAIDADDVERINGVRIDQRQFFEQVKIAASLCPTWIQTCMFAWKGDAPSAAQVAAYCAFLQMLLDEKIPIQGVLLYGVARPSLQAESAFVTALPKQALAKIAEQVVALGLPVQIHH